MSAKGREQLISRVLYSAKCRVGGHLSGTGVAPCLMRPTRGSASSLIPSAWPCSGWGLPCDRCHHLPGRLLPYLFTLTLWLPIRRSIFCGTILGVAPTGCYPAPCSAEPGLSSHRTFPMRDHLSYSHPSTISFHNLGR